MKKYECKLTIKEIIEKLKKLELMINKDYNDIILSDNFNNEIVPKNELKEVI